MTYGYGRGFGFRGASPAWPYVGRGRGGLPRCRYPGLLEVEPYGSALNRETELGLLKDQADVMKRQLGDIEKRIKELEQTLERQQKSEPYYQYIIQNTLHGALILQNDRLKFVNQAAADLLGYSVEELLSFDLQKLLQIYPPEDRETVLKNIQAQATASLAIFIDCSP